MELAAANYGRVISQTECKEIAEDKIRAQLKDPYSAIFEHQRCYKGFAKSVPLAGMPVHFGYIQNGTVNGKNSFGGYVGAKAYNVVINNGQVLRYCIASGEYDLCMPTR